MYQITIENDGVRQILHADDPDSSQRIAAGKLKEYVGITPSLALTVTPQNACYSMLTDRRTLIELKNTETGEIEFEGYLLKSPESMTNKGTLQKKLTFEGYLGYLNDSVQPYRTYDSADPSAFLLALLDWHNATTEESKHIQLGTVNVGSGYTASKTTAYRSTLAEIKENLVNRLGGELRVRRDANGILRLDYLTAATNGSTSDVIIELGHNLKSLSIESNTANIVTRLMPLGAQIDDITPSATGEHTAERLTIVGAVDPDDGHTYTVPYIDDTAAIAQYGIIAGTAEFDDITVPENLVSRGKAYLAENNRVRKHYAASVLDLSGKGRIRCGDTYRFRHRLMGLDENLRLLGRTVDILKPYTPEVEIGDKTAKITGITAKTQELINYEIPNQLSQTVQTAQRIATQMIEAATTGYVVVRPNEILIMDTDDVETATSVWRMNSGGIGYSSTGYHGPYGTAITMDGHIIGSYIAAGSIYADRIRGGTLKLGGSNNDDGEISVVNAANTEMLHVDASGLKTADAQNHWLKLAAGKLTGGYGNDEIGTIDATYTFVHDQQTLRGLHLAADGIHLSCTGLAINGGACTSGSITYVSGVSPVTETRNFVVDDGNGGQTVEQMTVVTDIQYTTNSVYFENGLIVTDLGGA